MNWKRFLSTAVIFTLSYFFAGCGGISNPISITVTPSAATVDGGDTATLTATVAHDKNSAGVTWSTSSGTLSSTTTSSATFTAPAATSSSQTVTITATSIADTTKTGTTTITIPAAPSITTTSASLAWSVGIAKSVTMAGSGGISSYTWSWAAASGSSLPSCLSLTSAGVLSGTPTASCAGNYSAVFTMTDSGTPTKLTATSTLTITITAPTITFATPTATASVGTAYSSSAAASGTVGTTTYAIASGSLPSSGDISLNTSTGAIVGTPYAKDAGTYTFTVSVADYYGDTATSGTFTLKITAPTITFATPTATASVGTAYSSSAAASGTVGTTTYAIASGSLPSSGDISLNTSTGTIIGTPYAKDAGTYTFAVSVTDYYGDTATSSTFTLKITAPTITFATPTATASVGTAYSSSAAASGTVGTTTYSIASGSLPSSGDLSLNTSTGAIVGTPYAKDTGTYTFTVSVTDQYGDTATSGSLSITVNAASAITFGTAPTATATAGVSYASTLSATGGAGSLTYSITSGSLPTGLTLTASTGAIAGAATTVGAYTFTAQAADNYGDTAATQSYTITVSPGAATHFTVAITSTTPVTAGGTVSFTVTAYDVDNNIATGYTGTVVFSSSDGKAAMPGSSVLVSGTGIGSFSATMKTSGSQTITATDSASSSIAGSSASFTVKAANATQLMVVPGVSTASPGVPVKFYVYAYDTYENAATGFTDLLAFTSTDSAAVLPANSALTNGAGTFSATMMTAGQQSITATDVSNSAFRATSAAFTVSSALNITTTSLASGNIGASYSQTLAAAGGSGSYSSWVITSGASSLTSLGLSLNTSTGVISGTPTASGTASFTVQVTDSGSATATQTLSITIYSALSLPTPDPSSLPSNAYVGVAYNGGNGGTITGSGGSGNLSIAVASGLPADSLTASSSGAVLTVSGTPASATTVTFSVILTDTTTGKSITQTGYTITVATPTAVSLPTPNPSTLGSAINGQSYTGTINASGGVSPYSWTINGSSVTSSGLSLGNGTLAAYSSSGSTLTISGTPSSTGTVTLTSVSVTDAASSNATNTYTITVNATNPLTVSIDSNAIPQGMVGMPYTLGNLNVNGGVQPYTITFSNLPGGLAQSTSNTLWVVGTPTAAGDPTVTVKVTDSATSMNTVSTTFTLPVVAATVAANNSSLSGQYACYVETYWDGGVSGTNGTFYRGGAAFAFTASGSGSITGGEMDSVSPSSGYKSATANGALSGSYVVGSDNRGYLDLTVNSEPILFAIAGGKLDSSSHFQELSLVTMDDAGSSPSGVRGGGNCYRQVTTTALSSLTLSGGYVFGWRGEDSDGYQESLIGFVKFTSSSSSISGEGDMVENGSYMNMPSLIGTYTPTPDSYGRTTYTVGPSTTKEMAFAAYLTNNTAGQVVMVSEGDHAASSSNVYDFYVGQAKAQVTADLSASYPLKGNSVMYTSGLDASTTSYKAKMMQIVGSTSASTVEPYASITNKAGTLTTTDSMVGKTITYTIDTTTGRTTLSVGGTTQTGDVFYVYDTDSAAVLFGDTGTSGTTAQNQLGWLEPQTAPTTWAVGDLSTSYFMYSTTNGDYGTDRSTMAITLDNSGNITRFAQEENGENWADWDEGLSGTYGVTATGAVALDATYGSYGLFNINMTESGSTTTQVYCFAIADDYATNGTTKGRLVCLDANSKSPRLNILQE